MRTQHGPGHEVLLGALLQCIVRAVEVFRLLWQAAVVQVIAGRLRFTVDGQVLDAGLGFWLHMAPETPHSLVATEPTIMLVHLMRP